MPRCVLIVDDNATIRKIIRAQCEAAGLEVCGEAADGLEAIEKAKELNPDLIIMDLSMPRMNGLDAARELKRICPDVPILLNTLHADVLRGQRELPVGGDRSSGKNRRPDGSRASYTGVRLTPTQFFLRTCSLDPGPLPMEFGISILCAACYVARRA
jgi:CheY-like chemotaxis protein